jgi:hypothetical protein
LLGETLNQIGKPKTKSAATANVVAKVPPVTSRAVLLHSMGLRESYAPLLA